ncbi:MAG: polysaccharide lyase [Verrucomicrobia bacterium]|nr:polysaccharide lyase [Verrucomicrobiota bacterium]
MQTPCRVLSPGALLAAALFVSCAPVPDAASASVRNGLDGTRHPRAGGAAAAVAAGGGVADMAAFREQAREALRRAVEFFRREVAVEGTYLWCYSEDLSRREGEGVATATRGWVQPPGTPSVGQALLTAYDATGDASYLEAARETALGLVRGQLQSGGWTYVIEFDPAQRHRYAYRNGGSPKGRNVTTLDDDTTQSALRFLMRIDQALGFRDPKIHECVRYALESLLKAQFPNGAWPQGFDTLPDPSRFPVRSAAYPETWSRTWPGSGRYWQHYTLNDNALATTLDTMLDASRVYGKPAPGNDCATLALRCRAAAEKAGDFLVRAQMPEPQPAWAQQYDVAMHPAWARKFEPPAVTGGESQAAMRTLLQLCRETGRRRYLEPIPSAIQYLRRSRLPDGRLARFYELRTNRPLYFTTDYQLTYDDRDLPTHYAFKVSDGTDAIAREHERTRQLLTQPHAPSPTPTPPPRIEEVKTVLNALDARGRWIEPGGLRYHRPKDPAVRVIRCDTFSRNVELLSRFLATHAD